MAEQRKLLGEYLVQKGIITESQLREAVEEQKRTSRKIGEVLVMLGFATEEDVAKALSEQLGFTYMDLSSYQVEPEAVGLISGDSALRLQAVPLFKVGDTLSVAMINPLDVASVDELARLTGGLRIKPLLTTTSGLKDAIEKYYARPGTRAGVSAQPSSRPSPAMVEARKQQAEDEPSRLMQEATQAPVIKLVNQLIEKAIDAGASDIHLEPREDSFCCRLRVDGILHEVESPPKKLQLAITSRIKIMAEMDIAQSRLPQDGRIQTQFLNRDIDLRIATFPGIYGEHISMRILDKTKGVLKISEVGFEETEVLGKVGEIITKPFGIVLVTGPTGSGKTTTLYAMLNTINDRKKNIVTLEDPIEYTIPGVHQSQVNIKAGLTFASGLRSIVRLDPDIIMIGEIRDKETADIAIHSSLTGHLVFSTLHTNDAPSAVARLTDIGVEPYLVASSLTGVLAQRLVRKLCPRCKIEYSPTDEEIKSISHDVKEAHKLHFFRPSGCNDCFYTGYRGRIGIFELFIPDNATKELIIRKAPAHQIKELACKAGMKTLRQDGLVKVMAGITSLSEVLSVTEET